jgi:hypothetical protein
MDDLPLQSFQQVSRLLPEKLCFVAHRQAGITQRKKPGPTVELHAPSRFDILFV